MSSGFEFLSLFTLALKSILPVFVWLFVGLVLRQLIASSDAFFRRSEKYLFYIAIPIVLFFSSSRIDTHALDLSRALLAGSIAIVITIVGAFFHARWRGFSFPTQGLVCQAAYRSNMAVFGIALCSSAFGDEGLVVAALPMAVWMMAFNVFGVLILSFTHEASSSVKSIFRAMLRNPLILSIGSGVAVAFMKFDPPEPVYESVSIFRSAVIPYTMVCLGGTLSLKGIRQAKAELVESCVWRLTIAPAIVVLCCLLLGVSGVELGVIFLLLASPVAVTSPLQVAAVGGDTRLAANMVLLSTVLSPITLSLGFFLLSLAGLIY